MCNTVLRQRVASAKDAHKSSCEGNTNVWYFATYIAQASYVQFTELILERQRISRIISLEPVI